MNIFIANNTLAQFYCLVTLVPLHSFSSLSHTIASNMEYQNFLQGGRWLPVGMLPEEATSEGSAPTLKRISPCIQT
jgi:hypothetical protein